MDESEKNISDEIAIQKVKALMSRYKFTWRTGLIKLLARDLGVGESRATKVIDALEKKGIIKYTGDLTDVGLNAKARQLVMTPEGAEMIKAGNIPSLY